MWIRYQTAHSVQSDLDLHCPQKLLVSSSVKKELISFLHSLFFQMKDRNTYPRYVQFFVRKLFSQFGLIQNFSFDEMFSIIEHTRKLFRDLIFLSFLHLSKCIQLLFSSTISLLCKNFDMAICVTSTDNLKHIFHRIIPLFLNYTFYSLSST